MSSQSYYELVRSNFRQWHTCGAGCKRLAARLISTIENMECHLTTLFRDLRREDLESAISRKLGFFSLTRIHASAGLIAFEHFYDFLAQSKIIDRQKRDSARAVCKGLWKGLKQSLHKEWEDHKFLESYIPKPDEMFGSVNK